MAVESPDVFESKPPPVRRLNRRPLLALVLVAGAVVAAIAYTAYQRARDNHRAAQNAKVVIDPASARDVLDRAPVAGLIEAAPPPPMPSVPTDRKDRVASSMPASPADAPHDDQTYAQEWDRWRQQVAQVDQERFQAAKAALTTPPTVTGFDRDSTGRTGDRRAGAGQLDPGALLGAGPPGLDSLQRLIEGATAAGGGIPAQGGDFAAENNAAGKAAWLGSVSRPGEYLGTSRVDPLSQYEVKTGTIIPGVMVGGINSDLPGQLVAQIRENVYDSVTGRHLLIPQGAKLIGTYDNQVTRGQTRVLVAWTRVIYPDGSSLDLGSMPGADGAGYAGFRDKVKNHYAKVFGNALLMSMFAAAAQLSQPDDSTSTGNYSSQQIAAAAMGQQLAQTGMAITQRNLNIQPTLTIRPGFRFNVMVTKDIVLAPWGG